MVSRLPLTVIHYSGTDPRSATGGVERFARTLELLFARVEYLTPDHRHERREAIERQVPIICDNQRVVDWPDGHPVIGFQHGVGAVKFQATRAPSHWILSRAQRRAARRPNTLWVACAKWVASTSERLYGTRVRHVIHHPVDCERFDGKLENQGSRLILHDARTRHKGRALIPTLQAAFPGWSFEPLACRPDDVPDRMRTARAFIHLSRYEGNSIVCNEAMAMNLPCLFTRVGLMNDPDPPPDVSIVDPEVAYGSRTGLIERMAAFLASIEDPRGNPRAWVLAYASPERSVAGWRRVITDFEEMSGWRLTHKPEAPGVPPTARARIDPSQ